jgi:hypothetical protein
MKIDRQPSGTGNDSRSSELRTQCRQLEQQLEVQTEFKNELFAECQKLKESLRQANHSKEALESVLMTRVRSLET